MPILAKPYLDSKTGQPVVSPTGWYISEKYDGERAIWDGSRLETRNGNTVNAPEWFLSAFPRIRLDGELWIDRGQFGLIGHVRKKNSEETMWRKTRYMVFDAPDDGTHPIEDRFLRLHIALNRVEKEWDSTIGPFPLVEVTQIRANGAEHVNRFYREIVSLGGEGIVLREPGSFYTDDRSSSFLKYKQIQDVEVVVCGYRAGHGRNTGRLGSFEVHPLDRMGRPVRGTTYHVAGISDQIRRDYLKTHPLGTVITMVFTERTKDHRPRHPRYKGIRGEMDLSDPDCRWTPDLGRKIHISLRKTPSQINLTLRRSRPLINLSLRVNLTLRKSVCDPSKITK